MKKIGILLLFLISLTSCTSFRGNKSVPISFFEVTNAILVDDEYILNKYLTENIGISESQLNTLVLETLENNSLKSLQSLLDRGADINYLDPNTSKTPIFYVRSLHALNMFIAEGADLNVIDENGDSLLAYFIKNKPLRYAETLIDAGANISSWDVVLQASIKGSANLIKKLLNSGASFSQLDKFGNYPIYYAYSEANILELLSEKGYNLKQTNIKKENVLGEVYLRAVANGYTEVVEKLWDMGVNPNYTSYGDNAVSIAKDTSNHKMLRFLNSKGLK